VRVGDTSDESRRDGSGAYVPWGIAALALAVRILPVRNVFADGEIYFTDSDSYYHLRRIVYDLAQFPGTLNHDPYLNFPEGATAIWPQTLDWILAALLWPFRDVASERDLERLLVWVAPVLGALTVVLLYRIALRYFGARVAVISALVLSVLPAHFWYSQVGFLDHHVVVSLCATMLLGATMDLVSRCADETDSHTGHLIRATGFGALLAFSLVIWPGALLYVALAEAALLGLLVASSSSQVRRRTLDCMFAANVAALILIAPLSLRNDLPQWGAYSAVVLSRFQPALFAAAILHAGVSRLFFEGFADRGWVDGVLQRFAAVVLLAGVVVGSSIALIPELLQSAGDSAQWLGRTDSFQALVGESVPLFVLHGEFTTEIASSRRSLFVYLFPIAIGWLAYLWRREDRKPALYSFVAWVVVLFAFTLLQKRFFNTFSVGLALTMGLSLSKGYELLAARRELEQNIRRLIVAAVAVALLAPSFWFYRDSVVGVAKAMVGAPIAPNRRGEINRVRREMTNWLRHNTPQTAGFLNSQEVPEYGVLARWGEGHFITYVARRPTVMGNFGDDLGRENFVLARSFFTSEPDRAEEILETLEVRYLVIRSMSESRVMAKILFARDGSRLERYRLLYEVGPIDGIEVPAYKIFEFVKGAELSGDAPPGSLVKAELDLETNLGREFVYVAVTESDATGRYRLRLAYATRGDTGGIQVAERYRIRAGDAGAEIEIEEEAVLQGTTIEGPSF
jgi:asparagine N-glycosylation enzyme membrane subunit Stt3